MGGIVGIQYRNVGLPREGDIIDRMLAQIQHRGDASITQLCAPNVFLGAAYHKDVQSKKQAMAFNESKKLCAVLDGEIFFNSFDNSCFPSENPPVSPFSKGGIDGPPSFPKRGLGGI
jgi:asparagine synthetase B (glutamine-hydrolysing)